MKNRLFLRHPGSSYTENYQPGSLGEWVIPASQVNEDED